MKPGRPKFEATSTQRNQVTALVACGVPRKQVAQYLGIDLKTLSKHFAREIREAACLANAKIATVLYQKALAGDTVSMLFWLKCRAGWKEHDPANRPALPAPQLGISFELGAPGRVRAEPFDADAAAAEIVPTGADRLDTISMPATAPETLPAPAQEFIPRAEPPKSPLSQWEILAMSPEEFARHNQPTAPALPALPPVHVHTAMVDTPCLWCRTLAAQST